MMQNDAIWNAIKTIGKVLAIVQIFPTSYPNIQSVYQVYGSPNARILYLKIV